MLPLQQQMQLGNAQQPIPPPPPQQTIPNPNDLSLAGVLHFLQTEWRRYERERNEWEIERAEMRVSPLFSPFFTRIYLFKFACICDYAQARIALLEGERRSFENIKIDLLRRVKMMEYALRVERSVSSLCSHRQPQILSATDTRSAQSNCSSHLARLQQESLHL